MANTTINIPKTHLIMGLCLPLAVLLGYFLAEPLESGSMAVVLLVIAALMVPILMKWHHPLLIFCWFLPIYPRFLPGRPPLWMLMAIASLLFAVLNRSVNANRRFLIVPSIVKPLVLLGIVILGTAWMTGGVGLRALGAEGRQGGKGYFYLAGAIAGYFALTSQPISLKRARLYVSMFFLGNLVSLVSVFAYVAGPAMYWMYMLVPEENAFENLGGTLSLTQDVVRVGGMTATTVGLSCFLLARYGLKGTLNIKAPWRLTLLLLTVAACLVSGYRSTCILLILTFACAFWLEGLHRTRMMAVAVAVVLVGAAVAFSQVHKLPLTIQRTLSFLPVELDAAIRENAQSSTDWRVEMWKDTLPLVPKYLFKGKGYALDPNEVFLTQVASYSGFETASAGSMLAGDYHNGPLSVLIPFGLPGLAAFVWLLVAIWRMLVHYHRHGAPELQTINTAFLAIFVAKVIFFSLIFGAFYNDLPTFTGIAGMSVCMNAWPSPVSKDVESEEESLQSFGRSTMLPVE
jgi:hypothetical protein